MTHSLPSSPLLGIVLSWKSSAKMFFILKGKNIYVPPLMPGFYELSIYGDLYRTVR